MGLSFLTVLGSPLEEDAILPQIPEACDSRDGPTGELNPVPFPCGKGFGTLRLKTNNLDLVTYSG